MSYRGAMLLKISSFKFLASMTQNLETFELPVVLVLVFTKVGITRVYYNKMGIN